MALKTKVSKNKNSIVKIILVFLGVVGLVLAAVSGYIYLQNRNIAARVGKEVITKDEFEARLPKEKGAIEAANRDNEENLNKKLETLKKDTLDKMIEEKILDIKAKELGISVSDSEIQAEQDKAIKDYKNKEEYERTISTAYGWNNEDVRMVIKYRLLKEKIEAKVVSFRSVKYIYVRWDATGHENDPSISKEEIEKQATQKANEYFEKVKTQGFDETAKIADQERVSSKIFLGTNEYLKINKNIPLAPEDIIAIWSLNKTGDVSGLVKSSGGYYAVYKLTEVTSGNFVNYEEFLKDTKSTLKVKVYLPEVLDKKGLLDELKTKLIGTTQAASCADCVSSKGVAWYGLVTDANTGAQLSDVNITVTSTGSGDQCPSNGTGNGWCGPKSGSVTTPTGGNMKPPGNLPGYYQFGRTDGLNSFVNCGWGTWWDANGVKHVGGAPWRLTASKGGYNTFQSNYDIAGKNGGIFNKDIPLTPNAKPNIVLNAKVIRDDSRNTNESLNGVSPIYKKLDAADTNSSVVFRVVAKNTGNATGTFRIIDDWGNNGISYNGSSYNGQKYQCIDVCNSNGNNILWQGDLGPGGTVTYDYRVILTQAARDYFLNAINSSIDYRIIGNVARVDWIDNYYNAGAGIDYGGHGNLSDWEPVKVYSTAVNLTINKFQRDGNGNPVNIASTWGYNIYKDDGTLYDTAAVVIGAGQNSGSTTIKVAKDQTYFVSEVPKADWDKYWYDGIVYEQGNTTSSFKVSEDSNVYFRNNKRYTLNLGKYQMDKNGAPVLTPQGITNIWNFEVKRDDGVTIGKPSITIGQGLVNGSTTVSLVSGLNYNVLETVLTGWRSYYRIGSSGGWNLGEATGNFLLDQDKEVQFRNNALITCGLESKPQSGDMPLTVELLAKLQNPANIPVSKYFWDFGDGATAETTVDNVNHTYAQEGLKNATLDVETNAEKSNCPSTAEVNIKKWSSQEQKEVAP